MLSGASRPASSFPWKIHSKCRRHAAMGRILPAILRCSMSQRLSSLSFSSFLLAVMLICLTGCTSAPPIQTAATHDYHLGAGDKVQIEVYNDREMSGQFEVDDSGQISI